MRDGRVGHAYLFSGPRGTGKTSTARILAKALNCAALEDGEPCGRCDSCIEIARGASLDVHELDAASNNGVDAMRDLVSHAALGTPGRWKVYIVDEVHMLSTAASNALLKTLEEPPGHVVFVLATTDAQKVLPTIRSRTQHFEFRLLGSETLSALLHQVRNATGLALPDEALDAAVRRGRGSARDALSALDQVAAGGHRRRRHRGAGRAGRVPGRARPARALVAVAHASEAGRDPQRLAADLAEYLRQGFLAIVAGELVSLSGADRTRVRGHRPSHGAPRAGAALEELGRAQVDMRDIPDQRVHLEVALIKLTHPQADDSTIALLERVERLERAVAEGRRRRSLARRRRRARSRHLPPTLGRTTPDPCGHHGATPARHRASSAPGTGAAVGDGPCARTGADRRCAATEAGPAARERPRSGPADPRGGRGARAVPSRRAVPRGRGDRRLERAPCPVRPPGGARPEAVATLPSRDELVQVWGDGLLAQLPNRARARFRVGRFIDVDGTGAVFALPNETHRSYCEEVRLDVEAALATRFGTAVPIRLVVDDEAAEEPGVAASLSGRRRARRRQPGAAAAPRRCADDGPTPRSASSARRSAPTVAEIVAGGRARRTTRPDLLDPAVLAAETEPAGAGLTPEERLKQAFPGAHEV